MGRTIKEKIYFNFNNETKLKKDLNNIGIKYDNWFVALKGKVVLRMIGTIH